MEEVELAKEIADVLRNNRPDETIYGAAKAAAGNAMSKKLIQTFLWPIAVGLIVEG